MINNIIVEYPNINDFIQRKLIEKCEREGITIGQVSLETKNVIYQSHYMLLVGLRVPYVLLRWTSLVYVYQK